MRSRFQFSENQMKDELIACIRHLLSASDVHNVMRTFLHQTCLLQGARGALVGLNAGLATQPGGSRSDFKAKTVGIIEAELLTHHVHDLPSIAGGGWDELVSVVTKLGWSPSQPRFSKCFGQVGDTDFCHFFGYAIRSNFGDVLGFVLYSTAEADPFTIADQNTTLIAQLSIFRMLELTGVRQCAFRNTEEAVEFYETTGSMFPSIDEVYSRTVHDLNGVFATVAMQSQLITYETSLTEKVQDRAQKILESIGHAETYLNRSESMTRIYNGKVDTLELSDLVDLASTTGALQPVYEIAVKADGPIENIIGTLSQKLILFFLYHNVIRLMTIRAQTSAERVKNDLSEARVEFIIDVQNQIAIMIGRLPSDPEVDLNTDMARDERKYQLGRRLNTPRRIIDQVLRSFGGTLGWETVGLETVMVMRLPMQDIHSSG